MPESETVKSKRDLFKERIAAKHPDSQFADDEAYFGQAYDDYDDYDKRIGEMEAREKSFSDMFTSNPKSARLMMEWKNGSDPTTALIRIYGKDILEAIDDPEKLKEIEDANQEFAKRVAESDKLEEEAKRNLVTSLEDIEKWQEQSGVSDEVVNKAAQTLSKMVADFLQGKFDHTTIEMIMKGQNYDADVEQAHQEGTVAGKNAKIEEKLRKSRKGDGTVILDGQGESGPSRPKHDLGALERLGGSKSIFERGGEKRISRR